VQNRSGCVCTHRERPQALRGRLLQQRRRDHAESVELLLQAQVLEGCVVFTDSERKLIQQGCRMRDASERLEVSLRIMRNTINTSIKALRAGLAIRQHKTHRSDQHTLLTVSRCRYLCPSIAPPLAARQAVHNTICRARNVREEHGTNSVSPAAAWHEYSQQRTSK